MDDIVKQLETALKDTTDLRTKIDLQNDLAWELRDTDPERSRALSETAYQLATSGPFGEQVYSNGAIKSLRGLPIRIDEPVIYRCRCRNPCKRSAISRAPACPAPKQTFCRASPLHLAL